MMILCTNLGFLEGYQCVLYYINNDAECEHQHLEILMKKYNDNIYNISLIDTPGYLKYQKTMITCLSKYRPNLVFLTIDPLEIDIKQLKYYLDIYDQI